MLCKKTNRVAMLITITLPSKYHAKNRKGLMVVPNPAYDSSLTPRIAAERLRNQWSFIRARVAKWGAAVWGMYLMEPDHDGTPHMHALVYCNAEHERAVRAIIRDSACQMEGFWDVRILGGGHPHARFEKYVKKYSAVTSRSALISIWGVVWGIRTSPVKFGDWS